MSSAFSIAGPRLREAGLSVIPIIPGGKAPGTLTKGEWRPMHDWSRFCDRLPTEKFEITSWSRLPDAGVGVALGPASAPGNMILVAGDIDTDDVAISSAILAVLPPSPVRKRGRVGQTGFYLASANVVSSAFNIGGKRVLDLLCHGRQTILPPTKHATTGLPYQWITPDTLEDFPIADLPVLPDDVVERLTEALKPLGLDAPPRHAAPKLGDAGNATLDVETPHRSLNDAALANLDAWIPALQLYGCHRVGDKYKAVAHWRESSSGRPTSERAPNLIISPFGIKDKGAEVGYTPLDLVMAACGVDLDTAFRWLQDHVAPVTPIVLNLTRPKVSDEPAPPREPDIPVEPLRVDICQPPGLLGEIVEWVTATSSKPVPTHNLGVSIAFLGSLMGRRFESPTRARTNFYILGLAGSGFGKDHPMAAIRQLSMTCGLGHFLSAEETKSDSAIRKMLERWPVSFMMMDEMGGFLKKVLDRRAPAHEKRMRDLMLTFFSRANQVYMGAEGATERAVMISNPHLCIYGASTPDDLWEAFDSSSGKDGLLARFLVLDGGDVRPRRVKPQMDVSDPPRELVKKVAALMDVKPPGNLNGVGNAAVKPIRAEWGAGAEDWFLACDERNMDMADKGGARGTVYARFAEHTLKLALVYAVGCEPARPVITIAGMEWAEAIVTSSMATLFKAMDNRVADNDRQREHLLVLRMIQESGADGLSKRMLVKLVNGRFDRKRIDDIVEQLSLSGDVEKVAGSSPAGGRPTERYVAA